jgi:hypothetical protein
MGLPSLIALPNATVDVDPVPLHKSNNLKEIVIEELRTELARARHKLLDALEHARSSDYGVSENAQMETPVAENVRMETLVALVSLIGKELGTTVRMELDENVLKGMSKSRVGRPHRMQLRSDDPILSSTQLLDHTGEVVATLANLVDVIFGRSSFSSKMVWRDTRIEMFSAYSTLVKKINVLRLHVGNDAMFYLYEGWEPLDPSAVFGYEEASDPVR